MMAGKRFTRLPLPGIPDNLQTRIAVLSVAVMLAVMLAAGFVVMSWYSAGLRHGTDLLLRSDLRAITEVVYLGDKNRVEIFGITEHGEEIPNALNHLRIQISDLDGNILLNSPGLDRLLPFTIESGTRQPRLRDERLNGEWVRVLSQRTALGNETGARDILISTVRSIEPLRNQERRLLGILMWSIPLPLIAVGLGGWYVARHSLQPLNEIIDSADEISANNLDARFPVRRQDQLGRLATTFNKLFQRLGNAFDSMRRFTSEVSHELRSPLTAIRARAELALAQQRSADEYQTCLADILDATDRLEKMTDTLLLLARGNAELVKPEYESIDLVDLTRRWVEHFQPLAEEKHQRLVLSLPETLPLEADSSMVERIVVNLLDNAIEYAPANTGIYISAGEHDRKVSLTVCNQSDVLQHDNAENLFQRHRRVHESNLDSRHIGLGLKLARWAAQTLNGSITATPSASGPISNGICFKVLLPA